MEHTTILQRVETFANKLNIKANKIIAWSFVQSIVSWIWGLQDNIKPSSIWISDILHTLLHKYNDDCI